MYNQLMLILQPVELIKTVRVLSAAGQRFLLLPGQAGKGNFDLLHSARRNRKNNTFGNLKKILAREKSVCYNHYCCCG